MPVQVPFGRTIQTQLEPPVSSSSGKGSLPSAGPGVYDDTVIPSNNNARTRTLVLCFDGTGDQFDEDNSNVVNFFSMLKKGDRNEQLAYYQSGIGTYTIPQLATPLRAKLEKTIDMAIANHLDAHVMGGYEFLMEHYKTGDKICIFGFSRGACTARALVGMIHKVGLLPAGNHHQVPFAYKMYSRVDATGWSQCITFKKAFTMDVEIEFVGVWDTVSSVGVTSHGVPFTRSNTSVRYFRHAISLDERRARFRPNYWYRLTGSDQEDNVPLTDVCEVWFAGCHCDVGGGSVKNGTRNSLARIPLRWMIRECFRTNTGIQFYREFFKDVGLDPDTFLDPRPPALAPTPTRVAQVVAAAHAPEPTTRQTSRWLAKVLRMTDGTSVDDASPTVASSFISEEDEEFADALSQKYDRLKLARPWWILEIFPIRLGEQNRKDDSWSYKWILNLGGGRKVPSDRGGKVLVHRSVKIRMEAEGLPEGKYVPKAHFQHHHHEWVD